MTTSPETAPAEVTGYGVTPAGFVPKPFGVLLDEAFTRARLTFGPDVDLRSASTLRKLLELGCLEDALLWMRLDSAYHCGFTATAVGDALDLLGADLGLARGHLAATGEVTIEVAPGAPKEHRFTLPVGTLVETAAPAQRFRLLAGATVVQHDPPDGSEKVTVAAEAVLPGRAGDIAAQQLVRITPGYAARQLSFDPGLVKVGNAQPFSGGDGYQSDDRYRRRLYALPRTLWTPEAVRAVVLALDGVRDVQVYDPLGGLDLTTPPFGEFCFGDNAFQTPRDPSNPYFFTITVAPGPGVPWQGDADLPGLRDQVLAAVRAVRPVSVFPTIEPADIVGVAVAGRLTLAGDADPAGVLAAARAALDAYLGTLRLGDPVRAAQVSRLLAEVPGVTDVRDLRLRRQPARFGEVVCGPPVVFGADTDLAAIELGCGENLTLAPREIAVFAGDSPLMDLRTAQ